MRSCYRLKLVDRKGLFMSALGQKRTFRSAIAMSALPPKADILRHVCIEPRAEFDILCSDKKSSPGTVYALLVNWCMLFKNCRRKRVPSAGSISKVNRDRFPTFFRTAEDP